MTDLTEIYRCKCGADGAIRKWDMQMQVEYELSNADEVGFIMSFLEEIIQCDLQEYSRKGIKFSIIGEKTKLPKSLQNIITSNEKATNGNKGLHFMMALNYGGRQDIIQATKRIGNKIINGLISPEEIDENLFNKELQTKCAEIPYPDLLIRTSGEQRFSNFLLWQLAYTELFFEEKYFPDFGEDDLKRALLDYQKRGRHFGG